MGSVSLYHMETNHQRFVLGLVRQGVVVDFDDRIHHLASVEHDTFNRLRHS